MKGIGMGYLYNTASESKKMGDGYGRNMYIEFVFLDL